MRIALDHIIDMRSATSEQPKAKANIDLGDTGLPPCILELGTDGYHHLAEWQSERVASGLVSQEQKHVQVS